MSQVDLQALQKKLDEFARERDWDQFHTLKNLAMALGSEVGELLEVFQWVSDEEARDGAQNAKIKSKLEEEVADIFLYLIRIADKAGIDLEAAALKKLKVNAKKYPVDLAKGNAKKYTEL